MIEIILVLWLLSGIVFAAVIYPRITECHLMAEHVVAVLACLICGPFAWWTWWANS